MPKQAIDRNKLLQIHDPTIKSFLNTIDTFTEPSQLSNGMWNKLYACIATVRNITKINYWIYTNYVYNYDVHTREVIKCEVSDGCPIGDFEHGNSYPSVKRTNRKNVGKAWRYDRQ
jgi:hypothetical protein